MGSPLAKHVPVVLTALLVRQVVRILQLLVLLEPMPVVQHRVIHVPVVLTALLVQQRVIHVPVVLTALLVPQVVFWIQLLVLLEPMPVAQQPFVIHVVLENTIIKQAKRLNQLLVKVAMWENTKTKREKHRATMIV